MANWCSLYTTIKLKNEKQASELLDRIEKTITKNNFDFGGEHYIFGIDSYLYEDEIHISGDARWEFPQEDMCKLVKWLKQTVPVRDMYVEMDYEERGC